MYHDSFTVSETSVIGMIARPLMIQLVGERSRRRGGDRTRIKGEGDRVRKGERRGERVCT